ncbi:MAG TPA: hypothetical protein VIT65_27640 [Microlunatus sp.]
MASRWFPEWSPVKQIEHDDIGRADDELDGSSETDDALSQRIAEALKERGWTVAAAAETALQMAR